MTDSMKREGARLSTYLEHHAISFEKLVEATGKRPHYLERVVKGIYPVTRPVCEVIDEMTGKNKGSTFNYCTKGEAKS